MLGRSWTASASAGRRHQDRRRRRACGKRWCAIRRSLSRTVTEKLLTYALGRGVEYDDMPMVRSIVREAGTNNYRFSSVVLGIVKSEPFQMNRKAEGVKRRWQTWLQSEGRNMFITKKHISRRTFLRGAGVTLALPLLDSMFPALVPLAKAQATPKTPALRRHLQSARVGAGHWALKRRAARTSFRSF